MTALVELHRDLAALQEYESGKGSTLTVLDLWHWEEHESMDWMVLHGN